MQDAETPQTKPAPQAANHPRPYELLFDEKTKQVFGIVTEEAVAAPIITPQSAADMTPRGLQERLKEKAFDSFFYPPNSLEKFLQSVRKRLPGRYLLGEKRDAQIVISISSDNSNARVQTTLAWGGTKLTPESIEQALEDNKICQETINAEKLQTLMSATDAVDLIIAEAKPPEHGENARLEALVSSISENKDIDTSQITAINQYERQEFTFVEIGDPLMKKISATPGTPGLDVRGKTIAARPGRDIQFAKPFENVQLADDDDNLLVSSIKGHPIVSPTGVKVDPVLMVNSVDINTGNIDYDGSLIVKRDIESGFKVSATGDVVVNGAVSRAEVHAGGSITIKGGVLGHDAEEEHGARLEAGTDISAKFLNQVSVSCGGFLEIAEYLMNCRVNAGGEVRLGQPTGRGCIIGGHIYSDAGIRAKVLGSDAYVATSVNVGGESSEHRYIIKLRKERKRRGYEFEQLQKILKKIQAKGHPTNLGAITLDKAAKIQNTVEALRLLIEGLDEKINSLAEKVQMQEHLSIKASGKIYPNVVASIHGKPYSFEETHSRVMLVHENNRTFITDYPNEK